MVGGQLPCLNQYGKRLEFLLYLRCASQVICKGHPIVTFSRALEQSPVYGRYYQHYLYRATLTAIAYAWLMANFGLTRYPSLNQCIKDYRMCCAWDWVKIFPSWTPVAGKLTKTIFLDQNLFNFNSKSPMIPPFCLQYLLQPIKMWKKYHQTGSGYWTYVLV